MNKKESFTYMTLFQMSYGRLAVVLAGTVILTAGNVFLRWGIGEALDTGKLQMSLVTAAGILLAVWLLLFYTRQILFSKIQKNIYHKLQLKVLHCSMEALEKNDMGRITTHYVTDVKQIDSFVNRILAKAFPGLVGWLVTVGLMFWFDLFLGIAAIIATISAALVLHRMSRPIAKGTGEYQTALESANQSVAKGLFHIEAVKTSCREEVFIQEHQEKLAVLQKKKRKVAVWEALLGAPMMAGSFGTIIFLTGLSGWFVLKGRISAGQLLTVVTLLDNIVSFVMSLEGTVSAFRKASVSMRRLNDFLEQEEEHRSNRETGQIREIIFDKICFAYPGGSGEELYHGFSERWQCGRIILIKGGNGKGKSTLIKLLTGIYEVISGQILINGVTMRQYDLAGLRERIVVVPQENILFQGSIRDNLTCGKNIGLERVEEVCIKLGIHEEILRMPKQYETVLTENGGALSAGQKQRLCLARALLREGDAYLFDEPTSALDKANRDRFTELLKTLSKDKIIVVITHEREFPGSAYVELELGGTKG